MSVHNFRDVGVALRGLNNGVELLPAGRLLRGGNLDMIDGNFEVIGNPKTVINLRVGVDRNPFGNIRAHHFFTPKGTERYHTNDKVVRGWLNEVISVFQDDNLALPVYVHCNFGRDRTGIVIASLLTILGIPQDLIAQEYHLSEGMDEHDAAMLQDALQHIAPNARAYFNKCNLHKIVANLRDKPLN